MYLSKKRLVELVNASTVLIVWYDGKQGSATSTNSEIVHFRKHMGRVSPQIWSAQHVRISSFSQTLITVQTEREGLILATHKAPTRKVMKCSAACGAQYITRHRPSCITRASITGEEKTNIENASNRNDK